jgi:acetamidase/formamidase
MTGPVFVRGARPGDVLQVDILEVTPIQTWGYTGIMPLRGALPDEFTNYQTMQIAIDLERNVCRLPWGRELALAPFFGILAVAPPPEWGRISAAPPRAFGGNMDNRDLRAGTTLYLPVFNDGALFSAGDGHARQGDGEVSFLALECPFETVRLTFDLRDDLPLASPIARTEEAWITLGFDEDLDEAAAIAIDGMLELMGREHGLGRHDALALASVVVDLRVTQMVNGVRGVHAVLRHDAIRFPAEGASVPIR